jgi:adenylate kinase family enzyme
MRCVGGYFRVISVSGESVSEFVSVLPPASTQVVLPVIKQRLAAPDVAAANGFLLDGFPRNLAQARVLPLLLPTQAAACSASPLPPQRIVALHLSLRRDLLLRKICERRGAYSLRSALNTARVEIRANTI